MSKQTTTMKAAAFAELFGELDDLAKRLQASQEAITSLEAHLKEVREAETTKAAAELSAAADKFGKVTTQSVDNFVDVANEALAKFMARTEEIKTILDKPVSSTTTAKAPQKPLAMKKPEPKSMLDEKKYSLSQAIKWALFFYFITCIGGFFFATCVHIFG